MNDIKSIIQKEEYIAIAINKYILQNATVPVKSTDSTALDWDLLLVDDYLGKNFNKYNPLLKSDIFVVFDSNKNAYIKGVVTDNTESTSNYDENYKYLYNFYINRVFRINTIPPIDTTKNNLYTGSQILYSNVQQEIINALNKNYKVLFEGDLCTSGEYFYELSNKELKYKYCKSPTNSLEVYQKSPVYSEDYSDLKYIKSDIGAKAYVMKNNFWYEYYYQGNTAPYWIPTGSGSALDVVDDGLSIEDRILSYIPSAKDILIKKDGGCMLANGDIFCWGNNSNKTSGVENYGQLDHTLSADYINTPVMLKVQNLDSEIDSKKWYNNPYRIKFEKMSMNNKNVCGVSPIFEYTEGGVIKKFGGDLFCNGVLNSDSFEDLPIVGENISSILKRNIDVHEGKEDLLNDSDEMYLVDINMVNGTWVALSDDGRVFTIGSNDKGALGINNSDESYYILTPQLVNTEGQVFKKIFALRDIKGFGALDQYNAFWYWGERPNGDIYTQPVQLDSGRAFYGDFIFVNSKEFVLKGFDGTYYRTSDNDSSIEVVPLSNVPNNALSVSYYNYDGNEIITYVNENMQLKNIGNNLDLTTCLSKSLNSCSSTQEDIFNASFSKLNDKTNLINGKNYANFTNVSIYENQAAESVSYMFYDEDFEDSSTNGWNIGYIHDGASVATKFLGRYGKNRIDTSSGAQTVYKTFNLGSEWANKNVKLTFDMYEIDTWDAGNRPEDTLNGKKESFFVYINDEQVDVDIYSIDTTSDDTKEGTLFGTNIPGTGTAWSPNDDEKHTYTYVITLDSNGSFKLGFGAILGEDWTNESFGIDNIKVTTQIDNVTFTNGVYTEDFEDQKSDDWNVPRGPGPSPATKFENYPIYEDYTLNILLQKVHQTYFLGRFNKLDAGGGDIYHGINDGSQEVSKVFSFGSENAGKEVKIEYDFYRIDNWRYNTFYTIDKFYTFVNDNKTETYPNGFAYLGLINNIRDSSGFYTDYKYHFSRTEYLDNFGNIKLGFGAYIKDNYIDQTSWGVDNIKFTLTGNIDPNTTPSTGSKEGPFICTTTGFDTESQMYCWGNVGRSIPILSTSLYDLSNISSLNKLFITQESEKNNQMSYDVFNNNGNLFLQYPTYIGGFDYPFYFK